MVEIKTHKKSKEISKGSPIWRLFTTVYLLVSFFIHQTFQVSILRSYVGKNEEDDLKTINFVDGVPYLLVVVENNTLKYSFVNDTQNSETLSLQGEQKNITIVISQNSLNTNRTESNLILYSKNSQLFEKLIIVINEKRLKNGENDKNQKPENITSEQIGPKIQIKTSSNDPIHAADMIKDGDNLFIRRKNGDAVFKILDSNYFINRVDKSPDSLIRNVIYLDNGVFVVIEVIEIDKKIKFFQQIRSKKLKNQVIYQTEEIDLQTQSIINLSNNQYLILIKNEFNLIIQLKSVNLEIKKSEILSTSTLPLDFSSVVKAIKQSQNSRNIILVLEVDNKTVIKYLKWQQSTEEYFFDSSKEYSILKDSSNILSSEIDFQTSTGLLAIPYSYKNKPWQILILQMGTCFLKFSDFPINLQCQSCSGPRAYECTTCHQDYSLEYDINCNQCDDPYCEQCEFSLCQKCHSDYFLVKNFTSNQKFCSLCNTDYCENCEDGFCRKCLKGSYLGSDQKCHACSNNCEFCDEQRGCLKCQNSFKFNADYQCVKCLTPYCRQCSGFNPTKQTSGDIATFSSPKESCSQCQKGYYLQDEMCYKCQENCSKCTSSSSCSTCSYGYVFWSAQSKFFIVVHVNDPSIMQCTEIIDDSPIFDNSCFKNSCDLFQCKTCQSGRKICLECQPGFYLDTSPDQDPDYPCLACSNYCFKCEGRGETCTSCFDGYEIESNGNCLKFTCTVSNCKLCQTREKGTSKMKCQICQQGYYLTNGSCTKCGANCLQCNSSGHCSICSNNYPILKNGNCEKSLTRNCLTSGSGFCQQCTTGSLYSSGSCFPCNEGCSSCKADLCQECKSNFNVKIENFEILKCREKCLDINCKVCTDDGYDGECSKCNPGFRNIENNRSQNQNGCQKCSIDNCDKCDNESDDSPSCNKCQEGRFLVEKLECNTCPQAHCSNCNGLKCVTCEPSYYLSKNDIFYIFDTRSGTNTSNKYIAFKGRCLHCSSNCKNCQNGDQCDECSEGFFLNKLSSCITCIDELCESCNTSTTNNTCKKCIKRASMIKGTCQMCKDGCQRCNQEGCLECQKEFFLNDTSCQACPKNCNSCDADNCLECLPNYVKLTSGACIEKENCLTNCGSCHTQPLNNAHCDICLEGYYLNYEQNSCTICDSDCEICENRFRCSDLETNSSIAIANLKKYGIQFDKINRDYGQSIDISFSFNNFNDTKFAIKNFDYIDNKSIMNLIEFKILNSTSVLGRDFGLYFELAEGFRYFLEDNIIKLKIKRTKNIENLIILLKILGPLNSTNSSQSQTETTTNHSRVPSPNSGQKTQDVSFELTQYYIPPFDLEYLTLFSYTIIILLLGLPYFVFICLIPIYRLKVDPNSGLIKCYIPDIWVASTIQSIQSTLLILFLNLEFRSSIFDCLFPSLYQVTENPKVSMKFRFGSNTNQIFELNSLNLIPISIILCIFFLPFWTIITCCYRRRRQNKMKKINKRLFRGVKTIDYMTLNFLLCFMVPNFTSCLGTLISTLYYSMYSLDLYNIVALLVSVYVLFVYLATFTGCKFTLSKSLQEIGRENIEQRARNNKRTHINLEIILHFLISLTVCCPRWNPNPQILGYIIVLPFGLIYQFWYIKSAAYEQYFVKYFKPWIQISKILLISSIIIPSFLTITSIHSNKIRICFQLFLALITIGMDYILLICRLVQICRNANFDNQYIKTNNDKEGLNQGGGEHNRVEYEVEVVDEVEVEEVDEDGDGEEEKVEGNLPQQSSSQAIFQLNKK